MYCKVSIDMLNPTTRVKEFPTRTAYGEVTDILGYLSTNGYPNNEKFPSEASDWNGYPSALMVRNNQNPIACAGGLRCSSEAAGEENFFYPDEPLTAFGTKYGDVYNSETGELDFDADFSNYSSKYGKKLLDKTVIKPGYCSQTWEFAPEQGNGTIKSVCLTHMSSAHTYDTENFVDDAAYAVGSDFTDKNYATLSDESVNNMNTLSTSCIHNHSWQEPRLNFAVANRSNANYGYYFTENNVVFIHVESINVQSGSNYITTLAYKRVPKEIVYRYIDVSAGSTRNSPISSLDLSQVSYPNQYEGTITINTGSHQVAPYFDNNYLIYQDRFAVALIHAYGVYGTMSYTPAPVTGGNEPAVNNYRGILRLEAAWIIQGDNISVSNYTMPYAISSFMAGSSYLGRGDTILLKDLSLMYVYEDVNSGSGKYRLVRRKLSGGTLIYDEVFNHSCIPFVPFMNKNMYCLCLSYQSYDGYTFFKKVFRSLTNNSVVGYGISINPGGATRNAISDCFPYGVVFYDKNNPFYLARPTTTAGGWTALVEYLLCLRTNYLLTKCNFRTPIIKTSDYIMQVTVEMFLED